MTKGADPKTCHRLVGLEPDNLLAFMALLGLLRALDEVRPAWRARACWDDKKQPLRPVLVLAAPQTEHDIAVAAAEGVLKLAECFVFDRDNLDYQQEEARALLAEDAADSNPHRQMLMDALMSDGAVRDDGRIWPTPFCLIFGQGWQYFLSRLSDVPRGILPNKLAKRKQPPDINDPSYIAASLFAPWQRADPTDGFRWDPADDRRYALRAVDPSGDPAGQQHGANRLAAIALPLLPGVTVTRRDKSRFLALMCSYTKEGEIAFTWPIWTRPARLAAIVALLGHPTVNGGKKGGGRVPTGIPYLVQARRISVGKFFNVTLGRLGDVNFFNPRHP
jgi:hypothetical protein